jgi:23S rRNA (uracil1939-C5)-methyltransferase
MADRVDRLIGVEIIPEAVENARAAAAANNIKNAEFICSDAGKAADELLKKGIRPEVISIDPPRKGCDELMLRSLVRLSPKRISMISCNPATAARDCAFLAEWGYRLEKIVPVDMFPHTMHVECVVLMVKERAGL